METETENPGEIDAALRKIAGIRVAREAARSTHIGLQAVIDRLHPIIAQIRANLESLEREAARYADPTDPRLTAYRDDISTTRRALVARELVLAGLRAEQNAAGAKYTAHARTVDQLIAAMREQESPEVLEALR